MYDWDGLKCFLALAREGSTLAVSKALGVNQTTVARRRLQRRVVEVRERKSTLIAELLACLPSPQEVRA